MARHPPAGDAGYTHRPGVRVIAIGFAALNPSLSMHCSVTSRTFQPRADRSPAAGYGADARAPRAPRARGILPPGANVVRVSQVTDTCRLAGGARRPSPGIRLD